MAEIYRDDSTKQVTLGVTGATVTAVKFVKGSREVTATPGPAVPIPYSVVATDGEFQVVWTFTVGPDIYTRTETHNVVTPFFTKDSLVAHDPDFSTLSDVQIVNLERKIRKVIETYCGQSFGYSEGTIDIYGNGSGVLSSPQRIISVDSLLPYGFSTDSGMSINTRFINDGRSLIGTAFYGSEDEEVQVTDFVIGAHISAPIRGFRSGQRYTLTGKFGYTNVPQEVLDAALALAEWYGCNESTWRERYVQSMRAADWRVDFNTATYSGTGSVTADQLLAPFIVSSMVVL